MARISTYALDASISTDDKLVGTDAEDSNITKNYQIGAFMAFITGNLNLDAFADDAAAGVGGIVSGKLYKTSGTGASPLNVAGIVMVKQ
tara:strand:- start:39 stop:305 length:267 start_codon:yes stop_codon:yes gene_type:complete